MQIESTCLCACGCGELVAWGRFRRGHHWRVPRPSTLAARFWSKVDRSNPDGCWPWLASTNENGYGRVGLGGKEEGEDLAHRVAYRLQRGPIPEGMDVCHTCDNPPCCRGDHLFLGTALDNVADMIAKGRRRVGVAPPERRARGESHGQARLREDQVREIRALAESGLAYAAIAERFSISKTSAWKIHRGKRWSHVD